MKESKLKAFGRLLTIMDELREQCPWDKKQTIESLRLLTIEETYELADAIADNNLQELKGEIAAPVLRSGTTRARPIYAAAPNASVYTTP